MITLSTISLDWMMIRNLSRAWSASRRVQFHIQMLCSVWLLVSKGSCQWRYRRHVWQINFLSGSVPPKHSSYAICLCNLNNFWTFFKLIYWDTVRITDKNNKKQKHYNEDHSVTVVELSTENTLSYSVCHITNNLYLLLGTFPVSQRRKKISRTSIIPQHTFCQK